MPLMLNLTPNFSQRLNRLSRIGCTALALGITPFASFAQTGAPTPTKAASTAHAKPSRKSAPKAAVAKVEFIIPAASAEQIEASKQVYYGTYDCEFKQTVHISEDPKHSSYVDVTHGKARYLMKPVMSSTGAVRLEDVRGETLMVQISSKSMLLNVRTGQRVIDDCITPHQRELVEAARAAKAEAALSAAAAASMAAPAAPASATVPAAASAPPAPTR